jgi:hypothetical protein
MENIEKQGFLRTVELPEGKVEIFGGNHSKPQKFPEGCEHFVDSADLIFLECIGDGVNDLFDIMNLENLPQYTELLKTAKAKEKKIILPDINVHGDFREDLFLIMESLAAVATKKLALNNSANG